MKQRIEYRNWKLSDLEVREGEVREGEKGSGLSFSGYAAVFDEWSEDLGWFREKVAEGAFRKTLKEGADVRFLVNHNTDLLLARRGSSTLKLTEDEKGLFVEADMADVSYARDVAELIRRGDMDQMSFAFQTIIDEWTHTPDGKDQRVLKEVRLIDVSVVTYPGYSQTSATVRSMDLDAIAAKLGDQDGAERALYALASTIEPAVYVAAMNELREGKALAQPNRDAIVAVVESLQALLRDAKPESEEAGAEATTSVEATTSIRLDVARRRLQILERIAS